VNRSRSNAPLAVHQEFLEHQRGFRRDIQGLRAIAVLFVMVFHANKAWLPSGFIGVDVFFTISGFIITSLIINSEKYFSWHDFYWGRIKRIVPAYVVMISVVGLVSSLLFVTTDFSFFKESMWYALIFASNQYFSSFGSYFAPGAHELPLLHTWSLAIEMQFYVFLPLLICLTPRKLLGWLIGFLCLALFVYAEWKLRLPDNQRHTYYSLLARAPEFLLGVLIAVTGLGRGWSTVYSSLAGFIGLLALGWSSVFIEASSFPGFASIVPCMASGLLIASRKGFVSKLLSASGFVWIGALSYSLYLWHWPVLALTRYYLGSYDLTSLWMLAFVVLTFLLSWMSFHWVETLSRGSSGFLSRPFGLSVLIIVAGLMIFGSIRLNGLVENPLPIEMTRYAPADKICHGQIVGNCIRGDVSLQPSVLVLGDSHAAQLNEFFDVAGKQDKFSARVITASNCVPLPDFDVKSIPDYSQADCRSQIAALVPYVADSQLIVIAGMWQWHVSHPDFIFALSRFLEQETQRNVRVIVLAQVPMFDINLLRLRRFSVLGLPLGITKNTEWVGANNTIASIVGQYKGAEFVDFSHSKFFADAPLNDGRLIYLDNHHLNELGARAYGQFAAPLLQKLFTINH
jgi:peptidoglycan/LPS O-acetylase OafA/YrhL